MKSEHDGRYKEHWHFSIHVTRSFTGEMIAACAWYWHTNRYPNVTTLLNLMTKASVVIFTSFIKSQEHEYFNYMFYKQTKLVYIDAPSTTFWDAGPSTAQQAHRGGDKGRLASPVVSACTLFYTFPKCSYLHTPYRCLAWFRSLIVNATPCYPPLQSREVEFNTEK